MRFMPVFAAAAALCIAAAAGPAQAEEAKHAEKNHIYLQATCPVSGQALGSMGDPIVKEYDGRQVKFCCSGCVPSFEENLDASMQGVDQAVVKAQKDDYPLETCVVSGEELGSMGEPVEHVHGNRLVRLCCAGCEGAVEQRPAEHIAKVDKAVVEEQEGAYPLETCVVSGQELGSMGEPVDVVLGDQLVRLCCAGCEKTLLKDAATHLAKIDEAKSPGDTES